ncbi:MAG: ABC transporter ATP-binding protein [Desulfarculales bacterium]|jgi:NitT/TauT family transport system ATP-binding protein|nr:ABC transporter ATP-binding protein [Desulfarculales bacterium]
MSILNANSPASASPASADGAPSQGLWVDKLYFAYDKVTVLEDISLTVKEGEFVSLLGASGSGKTTLLRLLAGLERPAGGRISWRGQAVTGPSLQRGTVFQEYSLFPWFRLRDNVALAVTKAAPGRSKNECRKMADDYLAMVGLGDAGKKYPHELSGGMRQRGAIARTLALGSPVLLMDEPFGALDPANRIRLQELLLGIWMESFPRRTVVFVTHDIDEAIFLGDRVLILGSSPGRIIGEIKLDFSRPRSSAGLFASDQFRSVRAEISGYYSRDAYRQMHAGLYVTSSGEGI